MIIITQNDEDLIEHRLMLVHRALEKLGVNYEILVIDNHSNDTTIQKIRKLHKAIPYIRIIVLSKPYNTDIALTAGLDNCIGDYAILLNIYTDPPRTIPLLVKKLLQNYDIIVGTHTYTIVKHGFLTSAFLKLVGALSMHEFQHREHRLTALNRKAINSITRTRRKSRNLSYIQYLIGLRQYTFSYRPLKRFRHKLSHQNFFQTVFSVINTVISNSFRPMRILTALGIFFSLLFLLYVFSIVVLYIVFDIKIAPQGWISVSTVIGTMFFLLFSLLTLLAEYMIRILDESRNEPFYFVADELDKSIILPQESPVNVV